MKGKQLQGSGVSQSFGETWMSDTATSAMTVQSGMRASNGGKTLHMSSSWSGGLGMTSSTQAGHGGGGSAGTKKTMKGVGKSNNSAKVGVLKSGSTEKQGPIDWSYLGLKMKYRGEREREDAWDTFLRSREFISSSTVTFPKDTLVYGLGDTMGSTGIASSTSTGMFSHTGSSSSQGTQLLPHMQTTSKSSLRSSRMMTLDQRSGKLRDTNSIFGRSGGLMSAMDTTNPNALTVFPTVQMERHPVYAWMESSVEKENAESNSRTINRLLMKRFVFDVQELWMANLEHIEEHKTLIRSGVIPRENTNTTSSAHVGPPTQLELMSTTQNVESDALVGFMPPDADDFSREHGLAHRRDIKEILDYQHQVQSVSQRRAFARAYQTATIPHPKVFLDYVASPTPSLEEPAPVLPKMESVLMNLSFLSSDPAEKRHGKKYFLSSHELTHSNAAMILHMERLLPSSDLLSCVVEDVVWRLTLLDTVSLCMRVYLASESNLALFLAESIASAPLLEEGTHSMETQTVFTSGDMCISLPNAIDGSQEWEANLHIAVLSQHSKPLPNSKDLFPLRITINAGIRPIGENGDAHHVLFLQCSPAELVTLLSLPTSVPLFDMSWWVSEERMNEVWVPLVQFLHLETEAPPADSNSYLRVPTGLLFRETPRSGPVALEGTLTQLQAVACAYELLCVLKVVEAGMDAKIAFPHLLITESGGQNILTEVGIYSMGQIAGTEPVPGMDDVLLSNDTNPANPEEGKLATGNNTHAKSWQVAAKQYTYKAIWERLPKLRGNLSLILNGLEPRVYDVPGASVIGRKGLWFADQLDATHEHTQVGAHFFRDSMRSITDSILVNTSLALDTAIFTPILLAWESFQQLPPAAVNELVEERIVSHAIPPYSLLADNLISVIETSLSSSLVIFSSFPTEGYDYPTFSPNMPPSGLKRHLPVRNKFGFRQQAVYHLLSIDPTVDAHVYGVTQQAALPNVMSTTGRNVWHNVIAISEAINRPRVPKDYHYILANATHSGTNEPSTFTGGMRAYEMTNVISSSFQAYEKENARIGLLKDVFHKQLALEEKIARVEEELINSEEIRKEALLTRLQHALDRRLRKANKTEIGWRRRFFTSVLLETQGNWERRKDRSGMIFFHHIIDPHGPPEKYGETCQWEVPFQWDGDLWAHLNTAIEGATVGVMGGAKHSVASTIFGDIKMSIGNQPMSGTDKLNVLRNTKSDSLEKNAENGSLSGSLNGAFDMPLNDWIPDESDMDAIGQGKVLDDHHKSAPAGDISLDSRMADRSVGEADVATIDTANLEHIAEQLVSSDELMRVIARRLGLPESQVVPADELSSVFSITSGIEHTGRMIPMAPRNEFHREEQIDEFDSDEDLWSDDEEEVGDFDIEKEIADDLHIPQDHRDAANMRRSDLKQLRGDLMKDAESTTPTLVPLLQFDGVESIHKLPEEQDFKSKMDKYSWRRLPRPDISSSFVAATQGSRTRGPEPDTCNTLNTPIFLAPISPVDACKYIPETFVTPIESLFIPNAAKDIERAIQTLERNIRREEELARNVPTDDLLMFGQAKEFTTVDAFLAKQYRNDKIAATNPEEAAQDNAILAAKSSNLAAMEDALAEDIDINTSDAHGNTLLLLAAQQGDKRMMKFLLRRGADLNAQNLAGNTVLHYLYAYGKYDLAEYVKSKGANDAIVNADHLTCYEGLNQTTLNNTYADPN